ncbi:TonB-dependent siderophore receptor [Paracidovorax avenae]|uniref:TonB-dependent siderophore receptor n=1 Tax=Paracidovorax avenae TaxID=80867 RepID=UPI000D202C0C|nr:TonB-dependent siderophore receptor [Paracidovorax avenae]AVS94910.1 TonB-dependent siderophore receptor [Paracidovorax avenae]AVT01252.1 TonB-dependent siderophore receptor [Paracidovorax avenae]AVT08326.1 TonB-dependent siderophore receptor [Paracidovorax avenae]
MPTPFRAPHPLHILRQPRSFALRGAALAAALCIAAAAHAQPLAIDLPAQPLAQSLSALARQSGAQIVFATELAQGLRAPALRGTLEVREALDRLVAGSGLVVRAQDGRTFTIERPQAAPGQAAGGAPALGEVRVQAARGEDTAYYAPSSASGTKTEAALRDVPQTIDVVPQQVIRDQGATSIQDTLRNVAGVGLSTGDGQRDQVSIRGFTSIGDQFVDGFRDDALYFRDLSNIERVEVVKGPAAVLYGRGSSGGLVNRVTKKPGIDVSDMALSVGSWADKRAEFDVGRAPAGSDWSWRVTGAAEDANSYRSQQFLERQAIAPSVLWKPDGATSLMLQADYLRDKRVTDFGIPAYQGRPVAVDPGTYYGSANARDADTSESRVSSFAATFEHRFSDTLRLRNALRYYHYELDRQNTLPGGAVNEAAGTVALTRSGIDRFEHGVFNQTELIQKLRTGSVEHEVLYGVELGQQNKDALSFSDGTVATVNLFHPVLPVVPLDGGGKLTASTLNRYDTRGLYVQDQLTFTQQWKLLAGLRYDRFGQATDNRLPGQADFERTDTTWSPRLGLVWQPDAVQSYYASVSRSYQPSAEMFALSASNASVKPERTTNYEVGTKWELLDGRATATASLFQLERTDIKTADPAQPTVLIPIGTQRTRGLELSLSGELRPGTQATFSYAFLDTRVTRSTATDAGQLVEGKRATLTPRNAFSAWITQQLGEAWSVGGGVNYVGDRFANLGNTVTLPSYVVVDAMAQYRIDRATTLQLNLRNLFDRNYIVSAHGSNANLNLPGAPRNATLTLRHSF